jgi:polysaccharide deacetylase 2 family uncharacterized protein YibQ
VKGRAPSPSAPWRRALRAAALSAALVLVGFLVVAVVTRPSPPPAGPVFEATAPPPAPGAAETASARRNAQTPDGHSGRTLKAMLEVDAVEADAYAAIPLAPAGEPLAAAPDPQLIETRAGLGLPRIGAGGRRPWQVYARPFDFRDDRPRLVVIATGFGLSRTASESAIVRLPAPVSLALDAYAGDAARWAARARQDGHEVLLALALEPADPLHVDPGPRALLSALSAAENARRLDAVLAAATGYVGVVASGGGAFVADAERLRPILAAVQGRGLMLVDATFATARPAMRLAGTMGLPRVEADLVLDDVPQAAAIDARLGALEAIARTRGVAVGLCGLDPGTLKRLAAWWPGLADRNFTLAPASAAADAQAVP